jgi:hypothetical protein
MAKEACEPDHGRVVAGGVQQLKPKYFSPEVRQKKRDLALKNRPWQFATGPKTPEGKARVAQNGRYAQKGVLSRRQIACRLAEFDAMANGLAEMRRRIGDLS